MNRDSRFKDRIVAALMGLAMAMSAAANSENNLQLWRLDCGEMAIDDISFFSDTFVYDGQSATISNGCYLVRHGDQYLLWDAGLGEDYLGNTEPDGGWTSSISVTIRNQLERIGVRRATSTSSASATSTATMLARLRHSLARRC